MTISPVLAVAFVIALPVVSAQKCYADDVVAGGSNVNFNCASKTSYKLIQNTDTDPITLPGCTPVQMWLFARHGARYPRNGNMTVPSGETELEALTQQMPTLRDAVIDNYLNGRGELCAKDVDNLRQWTIEIPSELEDTLAPSGQEEIHAIGQRYKARLPDLLAHSYEDTSYTFRFTPVSRVEQSSHYFAKGVWGKNKETTNACPEPIENDHLLRYYKACSKWSEEVDNNTESQVEWQKFINGPDIAAVVSAVSKRLGFIAPLTYDQVALTYTMCRYDKAIEYDKLSPWCAAFSNSDLLALEYIDDLLYYYKEGYGYEINWKQACKPVADVYNYFTLIVTGQTTKPYGIFNFSHSKAVTKLIARLGLFNDTLVPTASNFAFQQGRQWRTSRMEPFGINLVFVLFQCELNSYKVQLYVNERLTRLPGCSSDTCTFSEFSAVVAPIAQTCDLDLICENPPAHYSSKQVNNGSKRLNRK